MDERRRRELLAAMGIRLWQRRPDRLPWSSDRDISTESPAGPVEFPSSPTGPWEFRLEEAPIPTSQGVPASRLDWEALQARVAACTACAELVANRTQTVFGVGVRDADAMVVGEAPGADEDRLGEPFVGRAGKLLDAMLAAIGLSRRENCYIANILKCRPPNNRDPRPEEVANCLPYLERQIELVAPRALLAVGRIAAQNLLGVTTPIGRLRGKIHHYRGIPVVVTYHPAYLLRSPLEKRKAWEDLKRYRRLLQS